MSEIVFDEKGNIDPNKLEKSLRDALDFDVKYRQRDNMKKKACKVAGSYDEFKAMVDCAHLKRVNRKDIESLGAPKQGWINKNSSTSVSNSANILAGEVNGNENKTKVKLIKSKLDKRPKTPLELGRDLRRCTSKGDKFK